jgi:L-ascorbate metabolism protein UlaG (beta-lactamase superfamily)
MSYKLKNVPTDKWSISQTPQGTFLLVAWNSVGQYEFKTEQALVQAADMLDPKTITDVINGLTESCSCPNGPERPRCHHKFSFIQVRQLRGLVDVL